ncbi:MAG: HopJ type III effector protein [Pedobacter sp.]|nr:MAG: HopJ type III effector protein [Pedobacter sp.]
MTAQIVSLLDELKTNSLPFSKVIEFIEIYYQHTPTAFKNGDTQNEAAQNQGSAKVFAFAQLNQLSKQDTLHLFAEHYKSVLSTPDAIDHQNIRQFMVNGWDGIAFDGTALTAKKI